MSVSFAGLVRVYFAFRKRVGRKACVSFVGAVAFVVVLLVPKRVRAAIVGGEHQRLVRAPPLLGAPPRLRALALEPLVLLLLEPPRERLVILDRGGDGGRRGGGAAAGAAVVARVQRFLFSARHARPPRGAIARESRR